MGTITKTIGTASRDFSTLALWIASLPANLVTDGNSYVGQMFNDSEFVVTTAPTIVGITTDATHTITLTTGAGQSFSDNVNAQTNALTYNQANGVGVKSNTPYLNPSCLFVNAVSFVTVSKIQFSNTKNEQVVMMASSNSTITDCIIVSMDGTGFSNGVLGAGDTGSSGTNLKVTNNLIIVGSGVSGNGGPGVSVGNVGLITFANNTIVAPSDATSASPALRTAAGGHYAGLNKAVNNAIFGFASFTDDVTNFGSSGNNASDLSSTTVPGSSNQVSLTYTNQFQNTTNGGQDFRAKAGAALIDNGATDTTDIPGAIDIVGTSRPQGSAWDIGAWELIQASAAKASSTMLMMGVG